MTNRYAKRHYQDVARVIREASTSTTRTDYLTPLALQAAIREFCVLFRADNPRFRSAQFREACNCKEQLI